MENITSSQCESAIESIKIIPLFKILTFRYGGSVSHRFKIDNEYIRIVYIGFSIDFELLHKYEIAQKISKCFCALKFEEKQNNKTNKCIVIYDEKYEDLIKLAIEYSKTSNLDLLSELFKKLSIMHYIDNNILIFGFRSDSISSKHINEIINTFGVKHSKILDIDIVFIDKKYEEELSILL